MNNYLDAIDMYFSQRFLGDVLGENMLTYIA